MSTPQGLLRARRRLLRRTRAAGFQEADLRDSRTTSGLSSPESLLNGDPRQRLDIPCLAARHEARGDRCMAFQQPWLRAIGARSHWPAPPPRLVAAPGA